MIKNIITTIVIVLLLLGLSYLWIQNENKEKELVTVNGKVYELLSRQVKIIEVEKIVTQFKQGKSIYVETQIPVEVLISTQVDTMEILKDYYSTRIYSDTLIVEDLGYVSVIDSISENKIQSRTFEANLIQRTITETLIVKQLPKLQIWTGFVVATDLQPQAGVRQVNIKHTRLGASLGVTSKRRTHIGVDLGVSVHEAVLTPYVGVRYLWQIR